MIVMIIMIMIITILIQNRLKMDCLRKLSENNLNL